MRHSEWNFVATEYKVILTSRLSQPVRCLLKYFVSNFNINSQDDVAALLQSLSNDQH